MKRFEQAVEAVRCLQWLGAGASGAIGAAEIARLECLDPETVVQVLERLRQAGFVRLVQDDRYCLVREIGQIRVADVWAALGGPAAVTGPRVTVADLLEWESRAFAHESVARAA